MKIGTPPNIKHLMIRGLQSVCLKFKEGKLITQRYEDQCIFHYGYYLLQGPIKGKLSTHIAGFGLICLMKGSYSTFQNDIVNENECQLCYFPKNTPLVFQSKVNMRVFVFQFSLKEVKALKKYHPDFDKFIIAYEKKSQIIMLSKPYQIEVNIRLLIRKILDCDIENEYYRHLVINSYITQAYITIIGILRNIYLASIEENEDKALYLKLKAYISVNLNKDLSIQTLAYVFHTSGTKLRYLFMKYEGVSIGNFCRFKRFDKAKELLSTTTISIKEIANWIGYQSSNNFSSAFKKEFGINPSEFRNRN